MYAPMEKVLGDAETWGGWEAGEAGGERGSGGRGAEAVGEVGWEQRLGFQKIWECSENLVGQSGNPWFLVEKSRFAQKTDHSQIRSSPHHPITPSPHPPPIS